MLKPKEDLYRGGTMLQSYGDMLPELSYYHQINMPPAVQPDYSSSWYNSPPHQSGVQSGDEYYSSSRSSMSKTPEWTSYQQPDSAEHSPYITSQPNSNSVCSRGSEGSYHHSMVDHHSLQSMDGTQSMMLSSQMAEQNQTAPGILPPSLCQPPNAAALSNTPPHQDEESLMKIDGPITTKIEENKDTMKLPGFHQTFGTITEIGRFSQHDDYFESRPDEVVEPIKVSEAPPMEPPPKRKPRGRKRKVAETVANSRYEGEAEVSSATSGGGYPSWPRHHHCCGGDPSPSGQYYGGHWASRPHPYYPSHYSPYYSTQYNPPEYHYHHPYHPPYQASWPPRPTPDYLPYNYSNYV